MENYGSTFRELRQDKGFSLKEVASGIISVTALSNFENGTSDIKAANLFKLLARMNISVAEFMFKHDQEGLIDVMKMTRSVENTSVTNRRPSHTIKAVRSKYESLYEKYGEPYYQYIAIVCDYIANPDTISEQKKEVIRSYIFSIKRYDEFEFYLLKYFGDFFNEEELYDIYDRMDEDIANLSTYSPTKKDYTSFNRIFRCIRYKDVKQARRVYDAYAKNQSKSTFENAGAHLIAHFLKGLIEIGEGNPQGEVSCRLALDALVILEGFESVVDQLDKWVDHAKSIVD